MFKPESSPTFLRTLLVVYLFISVEQSDFLIPQVGTMLEIRIYYQIEITSLITLFSISHGGGGKVKKAFDAFVYHNLHVIKGES